MDVKTSCIREIQFFLRDQINQKTPKKIRNLRTKLISSLKNQFISRLLGQSKVPENPEKDRSFRLTQAHQFKGSSFTESKHQTSLR
jgi:hypothetical protein